MNAHIHPTMQAALAPFAPSGSFTEEQLLEADRYLAGPARDTQFANRRSELYAERSSHAALDQQQRWLASIGELPGV